MLDRLPSLGAGVMLKLNVLIMVGLICLYGRRSFFAEPPSPDDYLRFVPLCSSKVETCERKKIKQIS